MPTFDGKVVTYGKTRSGRRKKLFCGCGYIGTGNVMPYSTDEAMYEVESAGTLKKCDVCSYYPWFRLSKKPAPAKQKEEKKNAI